MSGGAYGNPCWASAISDSGFWVVLAISIWISTMRVLYVDFLTWKHRSRDHFSNTDWIVVVFKGVVGLIQRTVWTCYNRKRDIA